MDVTLGVVRILANPALQVDDVPAVSVGFGDGIDSLVFGLPAGIGLGIHTVTIAAGSLANAAGESLSVYTGQFAIVAQPQVDTLATTDLSPGTATLQGELTGGGFLVVFASKKDRAEVGSELHTNFQLSSGGEYLALTQADLTIASEFGPRFPTQFANTSYGLVANSSSTVLLGTEADAMVLVPTDGAGSHRRRARHLLDRRCGTFRRFGLDSR